MAAEERREDRNARESETRQQLRNPRPTRPAEQAAGSAQEGGTRGEDARRKDREERMDFDPTFKGFDQPYRSPRRK